MKKIRTGIIGSGFMGATHIEALQRIGGVEIIAIASDDERSSRGLAEKYNIPYIFSEWKELVQRSDIDIVHNCTPNYLHYEINKEVIKSGKNIISEKPLTVTPLQSEELLHLLKTNNVVNAVNFNYRFYPLIQHIKSEVESNDFGEIFYVHGHYLQDWLFYNTDYNWRLESTLSGNSRAIADIGSHWCDMIQFITGEKIIEVFANLITVHKKRIKPSESIQTFKHDNKDRSDSKLIDIDTEDAGTVMFKLDNGVNGVFTVSQVSAGRKNNFVVRIDGSKKSFEWDQENPNEVWFGYRDKANEILIKDPSLLNKNALEYAHYPGGHPEGYPDGPKNLFRKVYDYVRSGVEMNYEKCDFPTFIDGHTENKIVEAIIKSNKESKWIKA